jgi:hypothetical protein
MTFPDPGVIEALKGVIEKNPSGITISGIADKARLNRNRIAKYLNFLLLSGQLEMKKVGSARIYSISRRVPVSALINYSSDLALMLDREMQVQGINEKMSATLQYDKRKVIGTFIHDSEDLFLQDIDKILRHSELDAGIGLADLVTSINGERRHFLTRLIPVMYENGTPGIAIILHDTTEKQEYAETIAQFSRNHAFLHKKAGEFGELPAGADTWKTIASGIRELYPDSVFLLNSYNPQTFTFTIRYCCGRNERDLLSHLLGRDIVGLVVEAPEGYDRRRSFADIAQGKLVKIPGNLSVAAFGKIPKDAIDKFDKIVNIRELYTVGLAVQGVPYGNIIFFMRNDESMKHIDVLEIYARLAALTVKGRLAEIPDTTIRAL